MQFDIMTVDPPGIELSSPLEWFIALACLAGIVWIAVTILRGGAVPTDWVVWRRTLLAGSVLGVPLLILVLAYDEPPYYPKLFITWVTASVQAAGLLLFARRGPPLRTARA